MNKSDNMERKLENNDKKAETSNEANNNNCDPVQQGRVSYLVQKLKNIIKLITVEPLLICYIMPSVLSSIAVQNLNLEKACRVNLNYSTELCDGLIKQTLKDAPEEIEVQKLAAYVISWRIPLQTFLPSLLILFIGAWSDRTGKRKPCLIFPIFGEFLSAVGLLLCTYYFLTWPLEIAGIFEGLPPALTGGYPTMLLGIFTYLADHTTPEERTFRIGIVNTFISLAIPVGVALSGTLLHVVGYYGVFTVCLCFYVLAFLYGITKLKDKKELENQESRTSLMESCVLFFNWKHFVDTFRVVTKIRKSNRRLQTILLVVCYLFLMGPVHGSSSVQYLYARRNYQFTEVEFSIFSAYSVIVNFFGIIFALSLFSKHMKMNDCKLGALACVSKVLSTLVYAFAPSKQWLYLAPIVDLIGGVAVITMRSIATKVVEEDEIGKIMSVLGLSDAVINTISTPIFGAFYANTVAVFPGAHCLLEGLLIIPTIIIFLYMYKLQKKEDVSNEDTKIEDANGAQDNLGYEISHF